MSRRQRSDHCDLGVRMVAETPFSLSILRCYSIVDCRAGIVQFVTIFVDGVTFFHTTELQSLAISDAIGGGEGREVARLRSLLIDRASTFGKNGGDGDNREREVSWRMRVCDSEFRCFAAQRRWAMAATAMVVWES
ncbi:hypothetical protein TIFTF001_010869 [Ficus carica]|uniref:Uncharacterized protein n=1 Tax=Ficus carica TaxID=3494 RepID=A0AA88AKF5_FICCA|nr:hypothetical protein TIFTF001_010869 [Ficus carica]